MGVTYKENIDDIRNSRIAEMVGLLEREGMSVDVTDPHADPDKVYAMYGIRPVPALRPPYDLIGRGRGARRVPRTRRRLFPLHLPRGGPVGRHSRTL